MLTKVKRPYVENGFWWWYNPDKMGWFIGPSPTVGYPEWWKPNEWQLEGVS